MNEVEERELSPLDAYNMSRDPNAMTLGEIYAVRSRLGRAALGHWPMRDGEKEPPGLPPLPSADEARRIPRDRRELRAVIHGLPRPLRRMVFGAWRRRGRPQV